MNVPRLIHDRLPSLRGNTISDSSTSNAEWLARTRPDSSELSDPNALILEHLMTNIFLMEFVKESHAENSTICLRMHKKLYVTVRAFRPGGWAGWAPPKMVQFGFWGAFFKTLVGSIFSVGL